MTEQRFPNAPEFKHQVAPASAVAWRRRWNARPRAGETPALPQGVVIRTAKEQRRPTLVAILFSPQRHRVTEKAFAPSLCLCDSVVGRSFVTFVTTPATGSFCDFLYDELER